MKNKTVFFRAGRAKIWLGIFCFAACLFLSGCEFDQPVDSAPNAPIDENLLGEWKNPDGHRIGISKLDAEHYRITYDGEPFLVAYHTDFGTTKFLSAKVIRNASYIKHPRYMFFSYTFEKNNQKMRLKTVGYDLARSDTMPSADIRKLISANMNNPKLYADDQYLERISPPVAVVKPSNISPSSPSAKSGRFTSGDTEIYYEIYGAEKSGTPLVVLHGGPGFDHQYLLSNSAFTDLAKNRPVVFYDQRGTGKSAELTEDQKADLTNNLQDLFALTKFLGYKKIDLAGHSWGGFLAMAYAIMFPDRLSHLIVIDSLAMNSADYEKYEKFGSEFPKEYKAMNAKRMEALFKNDDQAMRDSIVEYMKMLFHSPKNRDSFIAGSDKFTYHNDVNESVFTSIEGVDLRSELKKLNVPTLIVHGRLDANISFESAEEIHSTIAKSQLEIFEQSGHLPFYEEKEKFVKTVEIFLGR